MVSPRRMGFLVLVLCVALVGAAMVLNGQAQVVPVPLGGSNERIISGDNFGFRLDGRGPDGRVIGTLVVRIDGQWLPVGGAGVHLLPSR
jgi:hypothetical protein